MFFENIRATLDTDRIVILLGILTAYVMRVTSRVTRHTETRVFSCCKKQQQITVWKVGDTLREARNVQYHALSGYKPCPFGSSVRFTRTLECCDYAGMPVAFRDHCLVSFSLGE